MDDAALRQNLIGIGLYSPAEAARLLRLRPGKISRWLRGHRIGERQYTRLWHPQIVFEDGQVYLGFRDLMEVRVANAFISEGVSPQTVRRAIEIATEMIGQAHPLSTTRFRTDGRSIFLQVLAEDGTETVIDLLKNQYAFRRIIEPSLRNIEFDDGGSPTRWWPSGRDGRVVLDPQRSFGQPIEHESGVPVATLVEAARAEGSIEMAARVWGVPVISIRKCIDYQDGLDRPLAA